MLILLRKNLTRELQKETLKNLFAESADLGSAILKDLETLEFHEDVK